MNGASINDLIQAMVHRIVERFHPEKIYLFGSRARGDHRPDSDIDLLIVMAIVGKSIDQRVAIRGSLRDFAVEKDVLVIRPEEYKRYRHTPGTLARMAEKEGKLLYDHAA